MQPYPPQYAPEHQPPAPQYPPQYGQPPQSPAPQYPPQYGQAQYPPSYGQPQYGQAQGQPYPQFQAPPPPPPPTVRGSLDDFYNQPSTGGGKSLAFETVGTRYVGIVTRPIGDGDIEQQTLPPDNRPAFFKDGRPKFVMKVPLQMQPSPAYPDGLAQWYVKGQARDELVRAMAEAGAPEGPPEAGAVIDVTHTGTRPSGPGMSPAKLVAVRYQRPQGAAPVATPTAPAAAPTPPPSNGRVNGGQPPQYVPAAQVFAPAASAPVPPPPAPAPPVPVPPVPAPPPAPNTPPVELSPEQNELLAKLTGAPTG